MELEGIEPSSKRGNNTLSTCLSLPLIFVRRQDQGHQPIGLSSKSYLPCEAKANQFRFIRTSVSNSLETTAFGRCLVLAPGAKIKLIYYYSIKQQEHNCYCQLSFESSDYRAPLQRSACLHTSSSRCQSHVSPSKTFCMSKTLVNR